MWQHGFPQLFIDGCSLTLLVKSITSYLWIQKPHHDFHMRWRRTLIYVNCQMCKSVDILMHMHISSLYSWSCSTLQFGLVMCCAVRMVSRVWLRRAMYRSLHMQACVIISAKIATTWAADFKQAQAITYGADQLDTGNHLGRRIVLNE